MIFKNLQTLAVGVCLIGVAQGALWADNRPDLRATGPAPPSSVWLDSLDLSCASQGCGEPGAGMSVDGHPITLGGKVYKHGFGTHAVSAIEVKLHGLARRFDAVVGVDDETGGKGSVGFTVTVDGKVVAATGTLRGGNTPMQISANLAGAKVLVLRVHDGGDGIYFEHADWAGALITLEPGAVARLQTARVPSPADGPPRIVYLSPSLIPAIHGARVVGGTPGYPFLYHLAVTGKAPLRFSVSGLPAGLRFNSGTRNITGALKHAGTYAVLVTAIGPAGSTVRGLTIIGGIHKLAQTPPMGWNSWNCWGGNVTEAEVKASADAMVSAGFANHGYTFVNIDDAWEGNRDAHGDITSNTKFPNMNALTDYIHSKGLHAGLYSSPGPKTCGGYPASYQHEGQDAATYADWGFDYLKYDWCSYGDIAGADHSIEAYQKPYRVMRAALDKAPRDIVYSLCQYGMGDVWNWGARCRREYVAHHRAT
jgi:alpha-galactosidase